MKKQINEVKRMQLIAGLITESEYQESLINENSGVIVYASSTSEGMFKELIVLNKRDIISDDKENEDGAMICVYKSNNEEDEFYYIDKVEI
jgi:hypothetical protein